MLGKVLIFFAATLIALVLLELGVRLFIPQNLDFFNSEKIVDSMKRRNTPNGRNDHYVGVPVRINSLGLRDQEIRLPKPAGVFRIIAVGDSVTFGYGVRLEQTYVKVLETKLNQHAPDGTRYEVIDAGVPGTDLNDYLHLLRDFSPRLEPDLILIGIYMDDIRDYNDSGKASLTRTTSLTRAAIDDANRLLLLNSQLYLLSYVSLKSVLYKTHILDINQTRPLEVFQAPPDKQRRVWESSFRLLTQITDFSRGHGYLLMLAVFPAEYQLSQAALDLYRKKFGVSAGPEVLKGIPQQRLRAFGAARGITVADLLPALRASNHGNLFLRDKAITYDPAHPSSLGHRIVADELYRQLTSSGLLRSAGLRHTPRP